jgi:indolepyruvate ferredoxin oxidoreductase beta subunit
MSNQPRTLNILIAALGGEGGGVLSDWLIATATLAGFPVQSTSIPGVAQRTGATTYYIEIFPHRAGAADRRPILALAPTPVDVDLLAASELIEAGRAMQNGFVTPERTTLVASTSRIYAIGERAAMADGRFDGERIVEAAEKLSRRAILFDMAATAEATGAPINAVLFGALIAAAVLPVSRTDAESAIRATGKSVDANLRGFAAGFEQAVAPSENVVPAASGTALPRDTDALFASAHALFPQPAHDVIELGLQRLIDYQGKAYAGLFLQRLAPIARLDQTGGAPDFVLTRETARFLALWMSYEDVIRVADLKTRADRLGRVRQDVRAGHSDVVRVVDFLKPGLDEFCSMLPPRLGKALLDAARKRGLEDRCNVGMHIHSSSVVGFLLLRLLAGLRWWRPHSWRYRVEQELIERWLRAIACTAARNAELALEIAECAQLVKGYGDTHKRGVRNFELIAQRYFDADGAASEVAAQVAGLRLARRAALADPEGSALQAEIERPFAARSATAPAREFATQRD